jgi:hypothetical protein
MRAPDCSVCGLFGSGDRPSFQITRPRQGNLPSPGLFGASSVDKKERIAKVKRALLGDCVPPPMDMPNGYASRYVWVILEDGSVHYAYFHGNGYAYEGNHTSNTGIFRWKREAITTGSATLQWREARPWVISWSATDPGTKTPSPTKEPRLRSKAEAQWSPR